MQIDHLYPLARAWDMGAARWPLRRRIDFANDQAANLLAVDGPANASKNDAGPGEWMPINRSYRCTYVLRYLQVARKYGSFPIVLETVRECLQDVFDVPGLTALMRDVAARRVKILEVETRMPSPFARSLLFGYVAQFVYEGDSPIAERRAAPWATKRPTLWTSGG